MPRVFVCSTGSTLLVCPYEKAGIKWQLRMTHLRSRKPNAKLSVNGTKPILLELRVQTHVYVLVLLLART